MTTSAAILPVGTPVNIWVGIRLMFGYPETGVIEDYIPDMPGGPVYQVGLKGYDVPFACLKPEWVFEHRTPEEEG